MRVILFILAIVAFLVGAVILAGAESAIHEIEGFVLFLVSAVFISGAAIVEAVNIMRKNLEEAAAVHINFLTAQLKGSTVAQENLRKCPFCAEMIQQEAKVCKHCGREITKKCPFCAEMTDVEAKFCERCGRELSQTWPGTDPDTIQKRPEIEAETQESLRQKRDILRKEADALEQQYWQTNDSALLPRIQELRKQIESAK